MQEVILYIAYVLPIVLFVLVVYFIAKYFKNSKGSS